MSMRNRLIALAAALCATVAFRSSSGLLRLRPPDTPVPIQLFGMHFHRLAKNTPWPHIPFGSWRLLAAYVDWPNLEPKRNQWDFKTLDEYMTMAEEHHVEVELPLVLTPTWASSEPQQNSYYATGNAAAPKSLADWKLYVQTVATRYKGRIHAYEIWNEPNLKGFYSGSLSELVAMARIAYETVKHVDPTATVCSPSPTEVSGVAWLDAYLRAGGGKYADVIGFHFYTNPGPPERTVLPLIRQVEQVMRNDGVAKPLWDTETGYFIENKQSSVNPTGKTGYNSVVLSEHEAADDVARMYILVWAAGIQRLFWYAWDDFNMGFVDRDGRTLKEVAIAYKQVENWLVGATMTSCGSDANGTWTCAITRPRKYHAWIVWNPNRTISSFLVQKSLKVTEVRDLSGITRALSTARMVDIGPSPILLVSSDMRSKLAQ